ncbi:endoplasmic reticulum resident protein 44-like [Montipora capricornis]|uniref:endoplasmic reticulum resident protein 44-like n=1 Tax=Montipora capricornis TaxID=246305 RepID=UPI0035F1BB2B
MDIRQVHTPCQQEITFENAEELTEEGLPFLLLFYHPDDRASIDLYKSEVGKQLCKRKDLPLIAIDSFKHMYLFPKFEDIKTPGKLQKFVADLHLESFTGSFTMDQILKNKRGLQILTMLLQLEWTQTTPAQKHNLKQTSQILENGSGSSKKEQTSPPENSVQKACTKLQ